MTLEKLGELDKFLLTVFAAITALGARHVFLSELCAQGGYQRADVLEAFGQQDEADALRKAEEEAKRLTTPEKSVQAQGDGDQGDGDPKPAPNPPQPAEPADPEEPANPADAPDFERTETEPAPAPAE